MQEYYDLHVHTNYSHDADKSENNSVINLCRTAKEKGLSGLAFSDHYDVDRQFSGKQILDLDGIKRDCDMAKEMFPELCVIHSVELAQQMYYRGISANTISKYNFDMVIASTHVVQCAEELILSRLDYANTPRSKIRYIAESYVRDEIYTSKYCDFDVYAHITYHLRYLRRAGVEDIAPVEKDADMYDEVFTNLIHRGKALEINTSGLRQGHGETFPNLFLIKRYIDLGGELFTIGSDSHTPNDLGADIPETAELLRSLGVKYTVYYRERKPVFVKL